MKKIIMILCTIVLLAGGIAIPAGAALNAVGPVDAANGFPVWYEDANLLRLAPCLDPGAQCLNPELGVPNPALPIVFPGNFPIEWFYYNATSTIADPAVDATFIVALEGSFANGVTPIAGDQMTFARIRFTINPRAAATANVPFTVTHPFGTITVTSRAVGQRLLVSQDIGLTPLVFTGALADGAVGGIVNADGRSIGPFLTAAPPALPRVTLPTGVHIGDGVTEVPVTGSPLGTNSFSISGGGVVATSNTFVLMGKVSGCAATNTAPIAVADPGAAAATGQPQIINVTANDTPGASVGPPPGTTPINKGSILVTVPPAHGTAVPNPDGTVTYTPNAAFVGPDSFTYTVQDNCALVSNAMAVPVIVENLTVDRAEFRPRTGKWTITGQSSAAAGSLMTLHKGDAAGPVIGTTTVQADGTFKFVGKSKTAPGSVTVTQSVAAQSAATVTRVKVMKVQ